MEKRWKIKPKADTEIIKHLSKKLNINEHLANLLAQRGIHTYEEARSFFRPEMSMLHDPFKIKDMDLAIARIEKAIAAREKILVYGDYDGWNGAALCILIFVMYILKGKSVFIFRTDGMLVAL